MNDATIRFVNRTSGAVKLPGRRGNRMALAPGEWVTDKYYERFARLASEPRTEAKPLTKEFSDGTPVGMDGLPPDDGDKITAPEQVRATPPVPGNMAPPISGCETSCEGGCEFPAETSVATANRINAEMDNPPLEDQPQPQTPAEQMASMEQQLEPGMAPPIPTQTTVPSPPQSPPPEPVNLPESSQELVSDEPQGLASVDDIIQQYELSDDELLETNEHYVKAIVDGEDSYISRFDTNWVTSHLSQMRRHITLKTRGEEDDESSE